MAGLQKFRQQHQDDFHYHHQGGQGVDLRRDAPLDHSVNVQRQRGGVGTRHEEADDEIIDGKGKGDEGSGYDARHDEGQGDVAEALPGSSVQIAGCLLVIAAHAVQPRAHGDHHEGQAERDMGQDQGTFAQRHLHLGEQYQQGQAHDDFGDQYGKINQAVDDALHFVFVPVQGDGGDGPQRGGDDGGSEADDQRVDEGFQHPSVVEQLLIPTEGETGPHRVDAGVVEGVHGQDDQRYVQKCQNCQGIG